MSVVSYGRCYAFFVSLLGGLFLNAATTDIFARNLRVRETCSRVLVTHGKMTLDDSSEGYPEGRSFSEIARNLSGIPENDLVPDFDVALSKMKKGSHVIDYGSGIGVAATEIVESFEMNVTGISKGNPKPNKSKKLEWFDDFFENIPEKAITKKFGKGDIAYDYWGILSYTVDIVESINKMSKIMKQNAWTYVFGNFRFEASDLKKYVDVKTKSFKVSELKKLDAHSHLTHLTGVITKSGEVIDLVTWLKRQKGMKVEMLQDSTFAFSFDGTPLEMNRLVAVDTFLNASPPARLFVEQ